ncbi:sn-glycerol-3-phosphate import ATP-binding protein UgpC [Serratia fonticola]|uniref:sn-glycerol-3-phosphate import ATP-binding protein UgpC n=1 Tax=Serratia fonticola TaxID=47917 RepID=A0A4U9W4Y0_SERFO|nr:sn-glycerol-3-phosphate import ATP-binding protein UgpC [Serratia fonticola]
MQLIELHNRLKQEGAAATMVYVTHDQVEAMTMGDRICVMNRGTIMQVDKPINLYHHPANRFVAEFIGSPSMNLHDLDLLRNAQGTQLRIDDRYLLTLPPALEKQLENYPHQRVCLGIRPEALRLCAAGTQNCFPARIATIERMVTKSCCTANWPDYASCCGLRLSQTGEPSIGEQIHFDV